MFTPPLDTISVILLHSTTSQWDMRKFGRAIASMVFSIFYFIVSFYFPFLAAFTNPSNLTSKMKLEDMKNLRGSPLVWTFVIVPALSVILKLPIKFWFVFFFLLFFKAPLFPSTFFYLQFWIYLKNWLWITFGVFFSIYHTLNISWFIEFFYPILTITKWLGVMKSIKMVEPWGWNESATCQMAELWGWNESDTCLRHFNGADKIFYSEPRSSFRT